EADFVESRARRKCRDVAAQTIMKAIRVDHHRHRIPSDVTLDPPFDLSVARILWFGFRADGIHIGRVDDSRHSYSLLTEARHQAVQKERSLLRRFLFENVFENKLQRLKPPLAFVAISTRAPLQLSLHFLDRRFLVAARSHLFHPGMDTGLILACLSNFRNDLNSTADGQPSMTISHGNSSLLCLSKQFTKRTIQENRTFTNEI